ncbi:MAG: DUF4229 domain-containing protein [Pseudonocardiales bacterium]|nr:DUF4229 domain-containing protein [Pseudonocardiales bacterium]
MTSAPGLVGPFLAYSAARLAIVAVVAGLMVAAGVPLLLALLIGLVAALPLSMVLLRGLRGRVDASMAVVRERRAGEREVLRARLRGDDVSDEPAGHPSDHPSDHTAQRQPDANEDRPAQQ